MGPHATIGREIELAAVESFLAVVSTGTAALVVEGEAGIGKTTIWLEAVRAAETRGYRVLQARPAESEAKLSYAALADLVAGAFDEQRSGLPLPQERALAAALLQAESDEAADPRTTATAVITILTALATDRPIVVAVDDLQWLDQASERALEFAARRLPPRVGLLLTRRSGGSAEVPLGLDRALPDGSLVRVVPGPLSLAALHDLLESRLGKCPERPTLVRLAATCGGNPFYALEIARALERRDGELERADPLPVPRSLQDLVTARVRELSAVAQQAVLVAASLSRPTVSVVVEALAPDADARAALVETEEAGVLVIGREGIRFVHPLLASAVYGSVSRGRRRQLHRRLAEVVLDPEERARHLALSATEADETMAADIERAARGAALRGAQNAAAELFEASCRLTPTDRADELARRLLGQASSSNAVGDFAGARLAAERAVESARGGLLRAKGLSLLGSLAWFQGAARTASRHFEQALAAAADREVQGPIYAKLVRCNFTLDLERAVEHADAAMELLSEERQPMLLAHVLIDRYIAGVLLGRRPPRALLERGLDLEARALPAAVEPPHVIPLIFFHCTDEFDAARARHAGEDRWYRERGEEILRADRLVQLALAELRAGRWEVAEQYVEKSCGTLVQAEARGPLAVLFAWRALVDAHLGRTERARATLVPLVEQLERAQQVYWSALSLSALGFVEFAAGEHAAADRALTRMREHADSLGIKDVLLDRSEPFHVESLLALGELERARVVLARLEERDRALPRPLDRGHAATSARSRSGCRG